MELLCLYVGTSGVKFTHRTNCLLFTYTRTSWKNVYTSTTATPRLPSPALNDPFSTVGPLTTSLINGTLCTLILYL